MFDKIADYIFTHIWSERIAIALLLISAASLDILTWWVVFTCRNVNVIVVILVNRLCLTYYNLWHWDDITDGWKEIKELFK